ncbi:MAG: hypothetical protein ACFN4G_01535, partial [Mitsuokella sp.]
MIWNKLNDFFDLHGDIASIQEITERINAGVRFRGTNLFTEPISATSSNLVLTNYQKKNKKNSK